MLAVAAIALAGCGLLAGAVPGAAPGPGFQGGASCSMMPGGACQEQINLAAARHPDAVQVDLACGVPVCDRAGGAGSVVVTLADGTKVTETFSYMGNAGPIPAPACAGVAVDVCRRVANSTVDDLPPSKAIRSISIACTIAPCTRDRGETAVEVTYADGTQFQTNTGWEGGPP